MTSVKVTRTYQGDKENGEIDGEHYQGEGLEVRVLNLWRPILGGSRGFFDRFLDIGQDGASRHFCGLAIYGVLLPTRGLGFLAVDRSSEADVRARRRAIYSIL